MHHRWERKLRSVIRVRPVIYTTVTTDSQPLIDAVKAGEMTDHGGMTTTRDIADVVTDSYWTVDEKLHALEQEGLIESTSFGNEHVWFVPDDDTDPLVKTTPDRTISTSTRDPLTT